MNGCLPAELKFGENTAEAPGPNHGPWVRKSSIYHYHYHYHYLQIIYIAIMIIFFITF